MIRCDNLLPQLLVDGPDLWRLHKEESEEVRGDGQGVDNIHRRLEIRGQATLNQFLFHLHEGPLFWCSSQAEAILDGEVGNADLRLVRVSLISLLVGP